MKSMYKKLIFTVITTIFISGCGSRSISYKLSEIDSLVNAEKYDSAYHEVKRIIPQLISNPEEKAYYNLLLTQTSCLTGNPCPTDSLIDYSIAFYEKIGDKKKLCDAYYYKAILLLNQESFTQAIFLCKKAEDLANQTHNLKQLFKVSEIITYINSVCGNSDLEQQYAKNTIRYALETKQKYWILSAYSRLCKTYQDHNQIDSAIICADKMIPLIQYSNIEEKPYFLNAIGFAYLKRDTVKAKKFFEESLSYKPLARTYENLAWVYHQEGNEEKAYELWKQALLTDDNVPKAKVLHNILQYDLERHNIEGACEKMGEIVFIKDSLNNVLKDRTIQKIQQEYDEKKTEEEHQQEILRWIVAALILVIVILLLLGYIRYKRYKAKIRLAEHQLIINSYQNEINLLKGQNKGNEQQIADLNKKINDLIEQESPRLYHGKMLYDKVMENKTTITWTLEDFKCFIDFYKANYYLSYARVDRKYHPNTVQNTFFLLLYELGKEDKDIRQILNITQEGIRSKRYRISQNMNRKQ